MINYTNEHNISTLLAAWLVHSDYDSGSNEYPDHKVMSATSLIKPIKPIILQERLKGLTLNIDISTLIASRIGSSLHDSLEKLWTHSYVTPLIKLGYSMEDISKILINPKEEDIKEDSIVIYIEQRYFKQFNHDIIVSGKIDKIVNGQLIDYKTTSVYSYIHQNNTEKYKLQGSIYRWLNPTQITNDKMIIEFIFTDWKKNLSETTNYPKSRIISQEIELYSLEEIDKFITNKINLYIQNKDITDQKLLPRCTDEELWKGDPVYKYFSDSSNIQGKSQKNFTSFSEAQEHLALKKKGTIIIKEGEAKACLYCPVFDICEQRQEYHSNKEDINET